MWTQGTGLIAIADVGREFDRIARAEWERHLHRALPELALQDRAVEFVEAQRRLDRVIVAARSLESAGPDWSASLTARIAECHLLEETSYLDHVVST